MTNRRLVQVVVIGALSVMMGLGQGCQGPNSTSTGNPSTPTSELVAMRIAAFTGSVSGGNSLSLMKMCFKRLRFKVTASGSSSGNIDFNPGEVDVTTAGVDLSSVDVPAGTYSRVEFDLEDGCGTGESLSVTNNSGTFSTNDSMTIRFDGTVVVSAGQTIDLLVQEIVNSLATVTNSSDLKDAAESASGGCQDD